MNESTLEYEIPNDDDDLPDVFSIRSERDELFREEDIIFAKHLSSAYWPAVFYKYGSVKKRKLPKAWVCFFNLDMDFSGKLNDAKHILSVPVKNLKRFTGEDRNEVIEKCRKNKGFLQAVEVAEDFMRKRALGKMEKFFEYTPKEQHCSEENEETDTFFDEKATTVETSGDEDKILIDSEAIDKEKKRINSLLNSVDEPEPSRETKSLVNWIRNKSKDILIDIVKGKIFSQRHETFTKGSQSERAKLRWYTGFGQVDEKSGEEVFSLLSSWYQQEFHSSAYNGLAYVSDVWLPEAMIYAISNIQNISYNQAEEVYLR